MKIAAPFLPMLILLALVCGADASAQETGKIIRTADGRVRQMNHRKAMKACPAGMRLPTVRELAEESQERGAKGILELSQVNPNTALESYDRIVAINPDGKADEFYFSFEGYKRPDGDFGKTWFWSSSLVSVDSTDAYVFHGGSRLGLDVAPGLYNKIAVFCVLDN